MTSFDPEYLAKFGHPLKGWDDPRPTEECLHCKGSGMTDPDNECGFCFRTPEPDDTVTDDDEWEDIPHYELCEMVIELRAEVQRLRAELDSEGNDANLLMLEIERLRAAGDALVGALENNLMATAVVLVNQWKEARRG